MTDDYELDNVKFELEQSIAEQIKLDNISKLENILTKSSPSDYIIYTNTLEQTLKQYLKTNFGIEHNVDMSKQSQQIRIPNDLFISDTVPLPDIVFKMTVYSDDFSRVQYEFLFRCLYFEGNLTIVLQTSKGLTTAVKGRFTGNDQYEIDNSVVYTTDDILSDIDDQSSYHKNAIKIASLGMAYNILGPWYAMQIMLLNPVIKERLFKNGSKEKLRYSTSSITGKETSPKHKKRKAKYVRYKEFNKLILEHDVIKKRHTLCWYVIGHYRTYKSGKKVWVHGYWKGPLRELQKNLDEGRERVL